MLATRERRARENSGKGARLAGGQMAPLTKSLKKQRSWLDKPSNIGQLAKVIGEGRCPLRVCPRTSARANFATRLTRKAR